MSEIRKKKILYIAGRVNKAVGAYHSLYTNLMEFKKMGIQPIVVISKHNEVEENLKTSNIEYKVIPFTSCTVPANHPSKIKGFIKNILNRFADYRIKKLMKQEKIDLVHINVSTINVGAKPALELHIPLVWHLREFLEEDVNMTYINKKKMRKLLCEANQVIAISNAVAKHFEKEYHVQNIVTIYNGIDFSSFKEKKVFLHKQIVFTILGRIVPQKGQWEAVQAFALLVQKEKNIQLMIVGNVGNQSYFEDICTFIKNKNLTEHVTILEHQKDLTQVWNQTDVALICSKKEGFGRVTAEFMLHHIPVIASNTGGSVELVENQRGLFYNYGEIVDLCKKMEYAIYHQDIMNQYASNALDYAKKMFEAKECARKIKSIYEQIM